MNEKAEKKLRVMLWKLCSLHDIKRYSEQGDSCNRVYANAIPEIIGKRDALINEIISFVEGLSDPTRKTNNDVHKNYCLDNGGVPTPAWVGFDPEV